MLLSQIEDKLTTLNALEGLKWIDSIFGASVKLSSALGPEAQLIHYWINQNKLQIEVFTIDTGRLFPESYELLKITNHAFKPKIKIYFPDNRSVEKLVKLKGPNSFYQSVEDRVECCHIRKVIPLKRALKDASVWITGLRADQSRSRQNMKMVEWNEVYQVVKYNPLFHWTSDEVMKLINEHNIPINKLHQRGFASIGCEPCTRAITPGEDERSGRWWWENSNKECGLHQKKKPVTT